MQYCTINLASKGVRVHVLAHVLAHILAHILANIFFHGRLTWFYPAHHELVTLFVGKAWGSGVGFADCKVKKGIL